jgi:hypothetical protein
MDKETLDIKVDNAIKAWEKGCIDTRQILETLFPHVDFKKRKRIRRFSPQITVGDTYVSIKLDYVDACHLTEMMGNDIIIPMAFDEEKRFPKHPISAFMLRLFYALNSKGVERHCPSATCKSWIC